jgi:carbamoyltransferase
LENIILGIHDGHNSGATLSGDGVILASVQEERLSRTKNEVGYPTLSIEEVLRIAGINATSIRSVVYSTNYMHDSSRLSDPGGWYANNDTQDESEQAKKERFDRRRNERVQIAASHLAISPEKISFVEHHLCHLAAAYFTCPWLDSEEDVLGLTLDGAGDGLSSTVSVCREGNLRRIADSPRDASLGKIYSRMTYFMGMNPWEHEYKLMGMAPYSDPVRSMQVSDKLKELLVVGADGLRFETPSNISTSDCYEFLSRNFERIRFDNLAGGVQKFCEDTMLEWVRSAISKTGIRKIVAGGGVFMNVKANMLIAELPEVEKLYVMPSAADESLSIGACLYKYYLDTETKEFSRSKLTNLYLGGEFSESDERKAADLAVGKGNFSISKPENIEQHCANTLAAGEIVARSAGRMEWGARALGNRSIMAPGKDYRVIEKLNNQIKQRDFWMPFAPSILEESAHRYFDDRKKLQPWFMTFAFRGSDAAIDELAAGTQQRDHTLRPQVVTKTANASYHRILSEYQSQTGIGGLVNTSFNLHGEPIVYTPTDAIRVFLASGLQHLALGSIFLSKA